MYNLQFNVISEPSLCLFSPFLPMGEKKKKKNCGTTYKNVPQ